MSSASADPFLIRGFASGPQWWHSPNTPLHLFLLLALKV